MREIVIDGANMNTRENMLYRGAGMVSGNNSSRLLLDYKAENPEAYHQLLEYIFGDEGIGINHLKLEMGSDINSSSGTEPAVKRSAKYKRTAGTLTIHMYSYTDSWDGESMIFPINLCPIGECSAASLWASLKKRALIAMRHQFRVLQVHGTEPANYTLSLQAQ